jgi:hypothetical protein
MRLASKGLAAIVLAGSLPLFAGSANSAPLGQGTALANTDMSSVEQVQYRRWRNGRWVGPAAGVAAGVAIGTAAGAYAYGGGYDAYAAVPAPRPGYIVRRGPAVGSYGMCSDDPEFNSAYPSWLCR